MRILSSPARKWTLPLLAGLLLAACSPKLAPEGHYQDTPVTADGVPGDWALPLRFSNASYTLQYNVTNDNKNLYICVSSADDNTQLRILRSGMTIYFDPKGKKGKDISLHFPIQKMSDPAGRSRYGDNGNGNTINYQNRAQNRDTRKEELLLQSNYYNTTGFLDMENGQFSPGDPKAPIQLAIKLNNNDSLLVYEVVIPLQHLVGADWLGKNAKKNCSVGVVIDATPGSGGGGGGPRPGGMGMRGMGMRGMGGGGGGGRRYGGGGQPAQKEDDNWYAFRLADRHG